MVEKYINQLQFGKLMMLGKIKAKNCCRNISEETIGMIDWPFRLSGRNHLHRHTTWTVVRENIFFYCSSVRVQCFPGEGEGQTDITQYQSSVKSTNIITCIDIMEGVNEVTRGDTTQPMP